MCIDTLKSNVFSRVIEWGHHWIRQSLTTCSVPRHYLNQCCLSSIGPLMKISSKIWNYMHNIFVSRKCVQNCNMKIWTIFFQTPYLLRPEYSDRTRAVLWLEMPSFIASPSHYDHVVEYDKRQFKLASTGKDFISILRPRQNDLHFANIFKFIFLYRMKMVIFSSHFHRYLCARVNKQ